MSKRKRMDVDAVVDKIDAVLLMVQGAARLAWTGETTDKPAAVAVEVAAILDVAAEKLNLVARQLAGSKDG